MPLFLFFSMPPSSPDNLELKAVLDVHGTSQLLLQSLAGNAIPVKEHRNAVMTLIDPSRIREQTFISGAEGVTQKQAFSRLGGVIVQKGIVLEPTPKKILIHNRLEATGNNSGHRVVTGSSILVSGDARKDPMEILDKKLILDEADTDEDSLPPELIGIGVSKAKEIYYLFLLYRKKLLKGLAGLPTRNPNADSVSVTTRGGAARLVKNKPLEQSILKRWKEF